MKLSTYLSFDGNAREAFEFYAEMLGGKVVATITYGEMPECGELPSEVRDRIAHGCLQIGDQYLMSSDATPEQPYQGVVGAHVMIDVAQPEEAERVFNVLSEGGKVQMPLGKTSWALKFGMTVDRFGVPWMVNCSDPSFGGDCPE